MRRFLYFFSALLWTAVNIPIRILIKMHKRLIIAGLILIGTAWGGLIAQSLSTGRERGMPFLSSVVTGLKAEARNNMVRLTWADSEDARGPVYMFRSARPFIETVPPDLQPVEIAYGTQFYIDETEGSGTWYYFLAASDLLGQRHDIIVSETNSIKVAASGATAPVARSDTAEPLPGLGISGIETQVEGEAVIISFNDDGDAGDKTEPYHKNLILYRSLHPVKQPGDLLNAVIVQSGLSSPFVDYPIPGLSWYYVIISEDEISGGSVSIYPGHNATKEAIVIAGAETPPAMATRAVRSMPLPAMSLYNAAPESDYFSAIPETVPLSEESNRALKTAQVQPQARPLPEKKPRVFVRDLEEPSGGEDSALMRIVQGPFVKQDWRTAHDELQRYLSLSRSAKTEARARFYLGQTCYFSGKYREALIEFLFAQPLHPTETHVWIEATLTALVR
jgi:hypothetical protein